MRILWLAILIPTLWAQSPNGQNLLEQGNRALDAKQYDQALDLFGQAAAADPKDYGAEFQLALTYSLVGRDRDAVPHYQKTLQLSPGLYEAELNLAITLVKMHDPSAAIPHFQAAVAKKPMEFKPALGLAQSLLATEKYADAESAFRKALELNSRSPQAESGLAMALGKQNKVDEAAPHFQQAFTLDRTYRSAFVELALLYEQNHRTAEAITFFKMFPDNPVAQEHLGELLTQAGEASEAIPTLEAVVEKSPTPARRIALAQAYVANKQPAKAEAAVAPAVEAAPRDTELRMFYGRLLRDQRKFPEAAAQFTAVTQLKPDSTEAWNELANVLILTAQYQEGLAALDRVRALAPESPGNLFYRALALDHLRQLPEAIESYRKFLAVSQGKFPDQEFQARQRSKTLELELRKSK